MHGKLFLYHHDENQIWNLRFKSESRSAIDEYIETITTLNAKIVSGKIKTRHPICIRWDFMDGRLPNLQKVILRAKMSPPPPELSYRIAYVFASNLTRLEIEAFRGELNHQGIERAYFDKANFEASTRWLLELD